MPTYNSSTWTPLITWASQWDWFTQRDYGSGVNEVAIVLQCCQHGGGSSTPSVDYRKKAVGIHLGFELEELKELPRETRKHLVAERLRTEIPEMLLKKKIRQFDATRFIADFKTRVKKAETLPVVEQKSQDPWAGPLNLEDLKQALNAQMRALAQQKATLPPSPRPVVEKPSPSKMVVALKQLQKRGLVRRDWTERGLKPSAKEVTERMQAVVAGCVSEQLGLMQKHASHRQLSAALVRQLSKCDRRGLDTEEQELLGDWFYKVAKIIGADIGDALNGWQYGPALGKLMRLNKANRDGL